MQKLALEFNIVNTVRDIRMDIQKAYNKKPLTRSIFESKGILLIAFTLPLEIKECNQYI